MHERRRYFRVLNQGNILARYQDTEVEVIDISANSAAIKNDPDLQLPNFGTIRIVINHSPIMVRYEILKTFEEKIILNFTEEEQVDAILKALKCNRAHFRIKNRGEVIARFEAHPIEVIDISAVSVAVKPSSRLPQSGTLKIIIYGFSQLVHYKTFKTLEDKIVLSFYDKKQTESLLRILKNIK